LEAGGSVAVLGPSGSGKSTLLNILGSLDRADGGTVRVDGLEVGTMNERSVAEYRAKTVGFVFQMHHLLPQCSVWENVLAPTLVRPRAERRLAQERAKSLLDEVGLAHRLEHRPGELSGGERQRVAVVRALVTQPKLLLADEPTGALDRGAAANLGEMLLALNRKRGVALVVVTHSRELAAKMQRVLELRDGRLVEVS
jgi:lipoprotein-releasing system ATP-binding protein